MGYGGHWNNLSVMDRFWHQVLPEPNSGCWLWLGHLHPGPSKRRDMGYGAFQVNGLRFPAHRFSYETFIGKIPEGLELDHKCRMPCCVNPDHLEPVTHRENVRRGNASVTWARMQKEKTHCRHGHEFSEENTYITYKGGRACRECGRKAALSCYHKKKKR